MKNRMGATMAQEIWEAARQGPKKGRIRQEIRPRRVRLRRLHSIFRLCACGDLITLIANQAFEYLPPVCGAMGSSPLVSRSRRVSRIHVRFKPS